MAGELLIASVVLETLAAVVVSEPSVLTLPLLSVTPVSDLLESLESELASVIPVPLDSVVPSLDSLAPLGLESLVPTLDAEYEDVLDSEEESGTEKRVMGFLFSWVIDLFNFIQLTFCGHACFL